MKNISKLSPLALAFMGDAIHTAYVREKVLDGEKSNQNNYHNSAKSFCNAKTQRETLEKLENELTEEEKDVVRRARNAHSKHTAKNFDEETYKKATAFESLVGYLYLTDQRERLSYILKRSMEEIS